MRTYRMWVPQRKGRADLHYGNADISEHSVVHISVSEATKRAEGKPLFGSDAAQDFSPHFGDASVTLQNVSVRNGGVDFYVLIASPTPLNIVADITVVDGPVTVVIGT